MTLDFESHRADLRRLAYRMLGSVSEVEDILQDAWLRAREIDATAVERPRALLARIVTNLCLDHLGSARRRREHYVGEWLPEPLPDAAPQIADPATALELANDLSLALLRVLERLSPLERAAFLLHDVFDFSFSDIARTLARSEASCRQLAARARAHVREARPRYQVSAAEGTRLCDTFLAAVGAGDIAALTALLTADVEFHSDGGGKVAAVPRPVIGAGRVARVIIGFARAYRADQVTISATWLNGNPALVLRDRRGAPIQTITFEPNADARIAALYVQRNPDKLRHLDGGEVASERAGDA